MSEQVNLNKIPKFSREILENFLIPLNPDVNIICLLNNLNAILCMMASSKRIKIQTSELHIPKIINYNALNFAPSGWSKDKPINELMGHVFTGYTRLFESKKAEYLQQERIKIEKEATELFGNENSKKKNAYIKTEYSKISQPKQEVSAATAPALYRDCLVLQKFGFGGVYIRIKELALFLDAQSTEKKDFLQMIIELYDGEMQPKSLKSEVNMESIHNMPVNCILYSSPSKLLEGKANLYFDSLMETGLARRSFVTYHDKLNLAELDIYNYRKTCDKAFKWGQDKSHEFEQILDLIPEKAIYKLSEESYLTYARYNNKNRKKATELDGKIHPVIITELLGRHWKTVLLAGLIAAIEHPQSLIITSQDIEYAIYQADLFAKDFEKFFKATPTSDAERLFYYFYENINTWLNKTDISNQKFVNKNRFKQWFDENLEHLYNIASERGFDVLEEPHGKNSLKYKLVINKLGQPLSPEVGDTNELF